MGAIKISSNSSVVVKIFSKFITSSICPINRLMHICTYTLHVYVTEVCIKWLISENEYNNRYKANYLRSKETKQIICSGLSSPGSDDGSAAEIDTPIKLRL